MFGVRTRALSRRTSETDCSPAATAIYPNRNIVNQILTINIRRLNAYRALETNACGNVKEKGPIGNLWMDYLNEWTEIKLSAICMSDVRVPADAGTINIWYLVVWVRVCECATFAERKMCRGGKLGGCGRFYFAPRGRGKAEISPEDRDARE